MRARPEQDRFLYLRGQVRAGSLGEPMYYLYHTEATTIKQGPPCFYCRGFAYTKKQ